MFQRKVINVLYVDDELHNLQSFNSNYRRDFNVFAAISPIEAELIISENEIHVLVVDQRMPLTTGVNFLSQSLIKYPYITRILITAYTEKHYLIEAVNSAKVFRFIEKPWDGEELERFIYEGYGFYLKNRKQHLCSSF